MVRVPTLVKLKCFSQTMFSPMIEIFFVKISIIGDWHVRGET